jgi:hypothetical protein
LSARAGRNACPTVFDTCRPHTRPCCETIPTLRQFSVSDRNCKAAGRLGRRTLTAAPGQSARSGRRRIEGISRRPVGTRGGKLGNFRVCCGRFGRCHPAGSSPGGGSPPATPAPWPRAAWSTAQNADDGKARRGERRQGARFPRHTGCRCRSKRAGLRTCFENHLEVLASRLDMSVIMAM